MIKKAKKLIEELGALPENEQEECAESLLRDLRRRKQQKRQESGGETGELYEPFQIMLDADLDFPSDYSETYEEHTPAPGVSERIEDVDVSESNITFHLTDGRIVSVLLELAAPGGDIRRAAELRNQSEWVRCPLARRR